MIIEREQVPMDVVFVGAGPANLAGALHLKKQVALHDELIDKGQKFGKKVGDLEIAIVEKGSFIGAHILSGAVMDPIAMRELLPDFIADGCPVDSVVTEDAFWYLTEKGGINSPLIPPPLKNKGKYIVSLSKVCEWLGEKCEEAGIHIFPEFRQPKFCTTRMMRSSASELATKASTKKATKSQTSSPASIFWRRLRFSAKARAVRSRNN